MSSGTRLAVDVSVFRFGEFTFDCGTRQLLHRMVERHLSPKAQQLLHLLLQARPRALSRDELYDALWPSTFVCETNLASVVNEVRRALGDDARAAQYIRTVHGFGYAFCGEIVPLPTHGFEGAMLLCEGTVYQLYEGENLVGRVPGARVVFTAPSVSRHHAVIRIENGAFSIHDLGSKNGTYVNGERIGRSPVLIPHRAQIGFGGLIASFVPRKISSTKSLRLDMEELERIVAGETSDRLTKWTARNSRVNSDRCARFSLQWFSSRILRTPRVRPRRPTSS